MDTDAGDILTIDDPETVQAARDLAALRGLTVAEALLQSLRSELRQECQSRERLVRMEEIAGEIRKHVAFPGTRSDHGWLYDEHGLPA